ncbi:hypothetical protein [Mycolicibacterium holsaticum]|uniref:hypothetical protein n=1 Tax=Mycolicibacterium holsaticum TaxID=152142 RepID=UPI001041DAE5|nr:hypothetical protein [Mycolicibacterium holsaticum]
MPRPRGHFGLQGDQGGVLGVGASSDCRTAGLAPLVEHQGRAEREDGQHHFWECDEHQEAEHGGDCRGPRHS